MEELLWLGVLLGVGEALAIGPLFISIVQESSSRGFGAGCRVILGATAVDTILLLPALLCVEVLALPQQYAPWLGVPGALGFLYLGLAALRDARRLWRGDGQQQAASGRSVWKGVVGTVANPLAWTLWLATDVPALLRAQQSGGVAGATLFVAAWFGASLAIEATLALIAARGCRVLGGRVQACISATAAALFLVLAGGLVATSTLPSLLGA